MLTNMPDLYRSESQLGRPGRYIEGMAAGSAPDVRKGLLKVPTGAGLGLEINPDFLRKNLAPGEEYWG
jgi:L-alanine-DL-glutamate epimerase-like enolase superfamily enzyme